MNQQEVMLVSTQQGGSLMKPFLVCFVGESGSGKTTLMQYLVKNYNYHMIDSYTTRPKRSSNEAGHIFLESKYTQFCPEKNYFSYVLDDTVQFFEPLVHTHFDGYDYWITKEQLSDSFVSLTAIDPVGLTQLTHKLPKEAYLVIYLHSDEAIRYERMLERNGHQEASRRLIHDRNAFRTVSCDYTLNMNSHTPATASFAIQQMILNYRQGEA